MRRSTAELSLLAAVTDANVDPSRALSAQDRGETAAVD